MLVDSGKNGEVGVITKNVRYIPVALAVDTQSVGVAVIIALMQIELVLVVAIVEYLKGVKHAVGFVIGDPHQGIVNSPTCNLCTQIVVGAKFRIMHLQVVRIAAEHPPVYLILVALGDGERRCCLVLLNQIVAVVSIIAGSDRTHSAVAIERPFVVVVEPSHQVFHVEARLHLVDTVEGTRVLLGAAIEGQSGIATRRGDAA